MTQYEMTEQLSEKCNVSLAEAKAALEEGDWNALTATHLLDQEKYRRMQALNEAAGTAVAVQVAPEEPVSEEPEAASEPATVQVVETAAQTDRPAAKQRRRGKGLKNLGDHIRRLVAWGNRNRLVVRRNGETALELPVTVLAALMLFAFWVCVPLLVIGLFAGCRYSFSGRDLDRENINGALERAANAADRVKQAAAKA